MQEDDKAAEKVVFGKTALSPSVLCKVEEKYEFGGIKKKPGRKIEIYAKAKTYIPIVLDYLECKIKKRENEDLEKRNKASLINSFEEYENDIENIENEARSPSIIDHAVKFDHIKYLLETGGANQRKSVSMRRESNSRGASGGVITINNTRSPQIAGLNSLNLTTHTRPVQIEEEKFGEETWRNVQKYWKAEFEESSINNHRKPLVDPKKRMQINVLLKNDHLTKRLVHNTMLERIVYTNHIKK
jgi:hypothetical protein